MGLTLTDLPTGIRQQTTRRQLSGGQILIQQGEPAEYIFWVISGRMRLVTFVDDQMITHYFVEADEFFSEGSLYFASYGCTAIAEMPTDVVAIPKDAFADALRTNTALSERYLETLTHRFQSVKTLLGLRGIPSARDRLRHYLMQRLAPGQSTVVLEKPLKAIASELALTPESLSRLLARLQTEGVITRKQRSISLSGEWLEDMSEYYKLNPDQEI
ncbi:MAG: Crp/Fnr family transcriptional regulator [Cyanobacteria bacterium J06626_14]